MNVSLDLTVEEVNVLLNLIGQQPISTGLFALAIKIKSQGDAQLPQEEAKEE